MIIAPMGTKKILLIFNNWRVGEEREKRLWDIHINSVRTLNVKTFFGKLNHSHFV